MENKVEKYFKEVGYTPQPGDTIEIVKLGNKEEHYGPGDVGTVCYIDDAGGIHVQWNNKGSIALLPMIDSFCVYKKETKGRVDYRGD